MQCVQQPLTVGPLILQLAVGEVTPVVACTGLNVLYKHVQLLVMEPSLSHVSLMLPTGFA